jgi:crotonobetainyl-CoA:carnitine CoA-transferase CaiB-like acyl-CoA transferase
MIKPLDGIRIIDLSRLLPGPFCTLLLEDLGAEIIKVESVNGGDYMRSMQPFIGKNSAYFLALNPGKKSFAFNLKHHKGREIFLKLAETSNVILESFRPGTVDRLGIGYQTIKKVNPGLVYCAISGFGQDGPDRDRAGHDLNYIARSGILGLSRQEGTPPPIPPVQVADLSSSMFAAIAILAALRESERSGEGSYLDIGMLDSAMSWLIMSVAEFVEGERDERGKLPLTGKYPCYNIYQTKDGKYMSLAALEPKFWSAFCLATNRKDLLSFQYSVKSEAFAEMQGLFASRTRNEWTTLLKSVDSCCEPVQSLEEALSDPQVRFRGLVREACLDGEKFIRLNSPVNFSKKGDLGVAPKLGEHTFSILKELGCHDEEITEMEKSGIILTHNP